MRYFYVFLFYVRKIKKLKWTSKHLPLWRLKIILADTLILWFFIPDERKEFYPLSGLSKFYFYSYVNFVWLSRKVEKFSAQDHYYFSSHENMKRLSNFHGLFHGKTIHLEKKKSAVILYIPNSILSSSWCITSFTPGGGGEGGGPKRIPEPLWPGFFHF